MIYLLQIVSHDEIGEEEYGTALDVVMLTFKRLKSVEKSRP